MPRDVHVAERQPPVRAHSLVGLPPHLRRRIYLYTGVARLDGIPNTYFLDGRRQSGTNQPVRDYDPPPTRNFAGLLRSCHALYVETAALLYSANRFVIFYSQGSFDHLRALSPTSLASLTSLKIVLNESCHELTISSYPPYCWCDGHADEYWAANHHCAKYRGGQHRCPLLDSAPGSDLTGLTSLKQAVQAMMGEWHDMVAHISSHISIGRLELLLVCDIDPDKHPYALEAAQLALAPITVLPRLRDCHIRLCKLPSYPLQQMAQETVLQACGKASPARLGPANLKISSALTSLPPELRIRILEYTDLITPWTEVTWSRQDRGYRVVPALCESSSLRCPPQNHNGCSLYICGPNLDFGRGYVPSSGCCFCRRRHAAFSLACNCWAPPTNLFLICRALYQDAQFVFFSGNRFIVHDFNATQPWGLPASQHEPGTPDYPFERLAVSVFLRDIVPTHCLAYLRFLELVFPPYVPHGWPHSKHPAILDWAVTVDWMRGQINAPALTLRVVMADFWAGPFIARRDITKELAGDIIRGYQRIHDPLIPLVRDKENGLAGFFMQVAHPARWNLDVLRRSQDDEGFLDLMHRNLNMRSERHVRGPVYPSKAEPSQSSWQRWYNTDPNGD